MDPISPDSPEIGRIIRRIYIRQQIYSILIAAAPSVYLMQLIPGFTDEQASEVSRLTLAVQTLLLGFIVPYVAIRWAVRRSFTTFPGDAPEGKLVRMLHIPGIIEVTMAMVTVFGVITYVGVGILKFDKSWWSLPWALGVLATLSLLTQVLQRRIFEAIIRPYAISEFLRLQNVTLKRSGFLWPRQSWQLPYVSALFVLATLGVTVTVLGRKGHAAYLHLLSATTTQGVSTPAEFAKLVEETVGLLANDLVLPVTLLGGYLLFIAALTTWYMARHQTFGVQAVQKALEGLAQGKPSLPDWVSTDEIGDLATATARVFEQLRNFSLSLKDSALSLKRSAEQLQESTAKQAEMLAIQATALQETQVTAEEIKNTSLVASQKAGNILQQAERANDISQSGEAAIQQTMGSIEGVGTQVRQMATSIKSLDERARQIARITSMVKDLADQSNMLALNAAIEAVRSGDSGKGFGVVAKEIRSLADQSIHATHSIRSILQDIGGAIGTAASLTDKGTQRVDASIKQVREFSEQIQQLAAIVGDNASSVRQINAAVTQQDAGIAQITQAVQQLTSVMEQTMSQMRASEEAITVVRTVAENVSGLVNSHGWTLDDSRSTPALGGTINPAQVSPR